MGKLSLLQIIACSFIVSLFIDLAELILALFDMHIEYTLESLCSKGT